VSPTEVSDGEPADGEPDPADEIPRADTSRADPAASSSEGSSSEAGRGEAELHPARELSVHLLRMLETRMEAASIAVQGEARRFTSRLQLKLLAAAGVFFAVWAGIVLLAIALPEHLRVPVLSAVVAGFVLLAIVALLYAKRKESSAGVGSMRWFLDCLRQDLELVSRVLSRQSAQNRPQPSNDRSPPHDLAA
jgi:uncharacterized membrane protein YqjE